MKAGLLAVAAFAAGAVAHPHRRHEHFHEQRDVVVETQWATEIDVVTATAPAAYVYVDQYGNRIDAPTSTPTSAVQHGNWGGDHGHGWSSSSPEASAAPATTAAPVVTATPTTTPEAYTAPVVSIPVVSVPVVSIPVVSIPVVSIPVVSSVPVVVASSQAPVASSSSGGSFAKNLGISYSPYKTNHDCKDAAEVASDVAALKDYPIIRIYGTDCNQVANVLAAAAPEQKLFLGIFDVTSDSAVTSEVGIITSAVKDWSRIDTISVGNEVVNSNQYPVAQAVSLVTSAAGTARAALRSAGYTGPVVIVDTATAILANPSICEASDYAAANCHAFFNSDATADTAGSYVLSQAQAVSKACGGKRTVITESGWPSGGQANGNAIPGVTEQQTATGNLESTFSSDLFLFSAYNDLWKSDFTGSFGAEHFWGILGTSSTS